MASVTNCPGMRGKKNTTLIFSRNSDGKGLKRPSWTNFLAINWKTPVDLSSIKLFENNSPGKKSRGIPVVFFFWFFDSQPHPKNVHFRQPISRNWCWWTGLVFDNERKKQGKIAISETLRRQVFFKKNFWNPSFFYWCLAQPAGGKVCTFVNQILETGVGKLDCYLTLSGKNTEKMPSCHEWKNLMHKLLSINICGTHHLFLGFPLLRSSQSWTIYAVFSK